MNEINRHEHRVIDDETLRARVREMIGAPKPAAQSRFSRFSRHPLTPLLIGFILTGLVGSSLTYYYTERQRQSEATRQLHEKELDAQRSQDAQALEFVRKKNLLETEHQQHLNAQALGDQTAREMRATDAARAAQQKDIDYARSQMNVVEDRKLELAKVLEVFVKYVNSDDPLNRTFGYDMFMFFGHGDWAARLIAQRGDPAGRDTLRNIQNSASEGASAKQMAFSGLAKISDTQLKRILSVVALFETGRADGNITATELRDGLRVGPKRILKPLEAYLRNSQSTYKEQLQPFMERVKAGDTELKEDSAFQALIQRLEADPVMTTVLEDQFRAEYLNPSLQIADQLGVKTVLGLAVIYDTSVSHGSRSAKNFVDKASAQLGGTPQSGVDEKQWVKTVLVIRREWLNAANRPPVIRRLVYRPDFFLSEAARDNWDLLPSFEAKPVPKSEEQ